VYIRKRAMSSLLLSLGATLPMGGCSPQATPVVVPPPAAVQTPVIAHPEPQFRLTATIQDLMEGQIDPSADALWDSVAFIATKAGIEDRQPRTDEQWKAVRTQAITLIEATNLLSMVGRRVAMADSPAGPGELRPAEIEQRVEASHDAFVQFARSLQDAGLKALSAIDARNPQGLMDAGAAIDEACEACHVTYWYPNQNRPGN
jgi:cytochrome c556